MTRSDEALELAERIRSLTKKRDYAADEQKNIWLALSYQAEIDSLVKREKAILKDEGK